MILIRYSIGGIPINVVLNHYVPINRNDIVNGDVQARINFNIQVNRPEYSNNNLDGTNQTTPWNNLTIGQTDIISWTFPSDVSGIVNISIEGLTNN